MLFFSQVFINWNDIMGWIHIYDLLVELTFVVHLKMYFLVFKFV
jgi:hypothetical protein